jgi:hypothetical protein
MSNVFGSIDIAQVIVENAGVDNFNGWLCDTLEELQVLDKVMLAAVLLTKDKETK